MALRYTTITEYPAYDVVEFTEGYNKVFDGEYLYNAKTHTSWKLGSVVGFAIKNGQDPIAAYNEAVKQGHEVHYAFGVGASITSHDAPKEAKRIAVEYGDIIEFHGQAFVIEKANNDNIDLVLCEDDDLSHGFEYEGVSSEAERDA